MRRILLIVTALASAGCATERPMGEWVRPTRYYDPVAERHLEEYSEMLWQIDARRIRLGLTPVFNRPVGLNIGIRRKVPIWLAGKGWTSCE